MVLRYRSHGKQGGFTIVELLTVVTITAILSIIAASVLVNTQVRGTKSAALNTVQEEARYILDRISFLLRNAQYLEENQYGELCEDSMTALRVRTADGEIIELYHTGSNRIAQNTGATIVTPPIAYISKLGMRVDTLTFSCEQVEGQTAALITITLTLATGDPAVLSAEAYHQGTFTTQTYIRSYR